MKLTSYLVLLVGIIGALFLMNRSSEVMIGEFDQFVNEDTPLYLSTVSLSTHVSETFILFERSLRLFPGGQRGRKRAAEYKEVQKAFFERSKLVQNELNHIRSLVANITGQIGEKGITKVATDQVEYATMATEIDELIQYQKSFEEDARWAYKQLERGRGPQADERISAAVETEAKMLANLDKMVSLYEGVSQSALDDMRNAKSKALKWPIILVVVSLLVAPFLKPKRSNRYRRGYSI